jgi:putative peptidoglycan lipid II flippase
VLLSRLLGFVREAVLAWQVGVAAETDAYYAAFQIPDLLNYFLAGGALSIAFIPLYTRMREQQGATAAERLYATVLGTVGAAALIATALLWWFADPLVAFQFRGFDAADQALTARLTRIVLPAQICFVVGGIVRAVLMAEGRFGAQAAAPLLYNLGIILGGVLLAPSLGVEGFAWGALGGALVGPLGFALWDARGRIPLRLRVAPLDRDFLRYLVVAAPLMAGVTLLTVDEWYDRWFGQGLGAGTIATLFYARRLMQVPVAAVGQTVATAALPVLAELVNARRRAELDDLVLRTLQAAVAFAVIGAGGMIALADPAVTLVYVRGAFTAADADPVAAALRVFSLAVPGWIAQQIAVRPFYARGDTWRPMLLGTGLALLAIPLYMALGPRHGVLGLAAAGALAISANALATLLLARRLHGAPDLGALASSAARALLVAVPAAALAWALLPVLAGMTGAVGATGALLALGVGGGVYALAVAAGIAWAGDEPMRAAGGRLLRALRRRAGRA